MSSLVDESEAGEYVIVLNLPDQRVLTGMIPEFVTEALHADRLDSCKYGLGHGFQETTQGVDIVRIELNQQVEVREVGREH